MKIDTPVGTFFTPGHVSSQRIQVMQRALSWCEGIVHSSSYWTSVNARGGKAYLRTINGHAIHLYPLLSARQDCGDFSAGFSRRHVPISVNGRDICVANTHRSFSMPHTDMVASLLALLNTEHISVPDVPNTLGRTLYPETFRGGRTFYAPNPLHIALMEFRRGDFSDREALAYLAEDPERWFAVHQDLSWEQFPETTSHHVARIMALDPGEATDVEVLWALARMRENNPVQYHDALQLHLYNWDHPSVVEYAVDQCAPQDAREAWSLFHRGCFADSALAWRFHERLQEWPELHDALVEGSLEMYDASEAAEFCFPVLSWLSHHRDVERQMEGVMKHLLSNQRNEAFRRFLREANFTQPWLEEVAMEHITTLIPSVQDGLLIATAGNMSFNPYRVWTSVMEGASGGIQRRILRNTHRLEPHQALELIKIGLASKWRFVVKRACMALVNVPYDDDVKSILETHLASPHMSIQLACEKAAVFHGHPR